ncbi:hypothetical protein [Brasilonema sp. UFV-L1]|uniref:hypothetical protein n=1 Tax=Brasilonema sp. UFV-L1 TaxID=2234130 RepID=UPI00145D8C86|nr:hypothetical protein [Brasilonema sp. UFV-L1]NMG09799.1 hypothetical protein [Brasilonema sp. UFV-L1]
MLPFKATRGNINFSEYFHKIFQNRNFKIWGWLIAFLIISVFNGWLIKVSSVSIPIVIYVALFPLASIIYSRFCKKTWLLIVILVISRLILAFMLCILRLPEISQVTIVLYGLSILFVTFLLINIASTRGMVVPALTVILIILLWMIIGWQAIIRLVLYCNLIVTFNKAGRRLSKYLKSFNAAMAVLSGTAAFGLALGWMLGSL